MTQSTNPVPSYTPPTWIPADPADPLKSGFSPSLVPALHAIPPKVAAAIVQVMAGVPMLQRDEKNVHGNYAFAGIDSFLEAVRPLCAKAGLIILQDEVSTDMITAGVDRNGKPRNWLRIVHGFTLAHSSGETWQHRPQRTAMVDATMGSQGYGAAQSYTLKLFLRSLFQIATGEGQDVDHQPPNPLPGKEDERDAFLASCRKMIASHTDVAKLSAWWNSEEEKALRRRHDLSPQELQLLKDTVLARRQDIDGLRRGPGPEPKATPPTPLRQGGQPPAPDDDYEHPGDLTQRILDSLDSMNVELEIRDYMTDNEVWRKIHEGFFTKPQQAVIEKAFKQAIERTPEPSYEPPNPNA